MIELRNVSKSYGTKEHTFDALKDISFKIENGVSVAIVGKSGSGKSTLMHVMSGLDRASSGVISIDGQDISTLKSRALDSFRATKIGFIFQAFFVQANETCVENVAMPLEIAGVQPGERKELIDAALAQVELTEKETSKAKNLSGGQKQRLAIARAIVNKPSIIFADEPTGNLDSATSEIVEDLLFSFNRDLGTTLVIVTHDTDLAKKCDMQIHVKDGVVEKIVTPKKVIA